MAGIWALLLCLSLIPMSVKAQGFQVRNWHIENGVPDSTVTSLAQTPDGYLWIGTHKGLARFDGDSFKRVEAGSHSALQDSRILALITDHQGGLWIASESGLISEFLGGDFHTRFSPDADGAGNDPVRDFLPGWRDINCMFGIDSAGAIWALNIRGELLRFTNSNAPANISVTHLPPGSIRGLTGDTIGRPWILKGASACVFADGQWESSFSNGVSVPGDMSCSAGDNAIWTSEVSGSQVFADLVQCKYGGNWNLSSIPIPTTPAHPPVSAMLQDHRGRVWMAVRWGGVYCQSQDGNWTHIQETGPLAKCTARCLFEDRQGSIWVGTIGEGLDHIMESAVKTVMLPPEASDVHATTVCAGKDGLWMGTDKSLYYKSYAPSSRVTEVEGLKGESIYSVLEDKEANLWVGTRCGLLRRESSGFKSILSLTNYSGDIVALFEDRAGDVWAGGYRGMLFRKRAGAGDSQFEQMTCDPSLRICSIAENPQGQIWVATRTSGLWRLDGKQLVRSGPPLGAHDVDTRSLLFDKDGDLWIGTYGDGLFRVNNTEVQHYTTDDGLLDDVILGLLEDDQGNLWMTSRNGILGCSCRQLAEHAQNQSAPLLCKCLGLDQGLINRECTGAGQPVISRDRNGEFWVATMVGAARFLPRISTRGAPGSEVRVDALIVDGVPQTLAAQEVRVPASSRHFEFQYSAPELAAPKTLRFRYRLDGLDGNWLEAGSSRVASYSKLLPGEYHFRVMAGGEDGIWREAKTPVILNVVPRFWQTGWFRAAGLAGIGILTLGIVTLNQRRRDRRRLERLEAQQAVDRVRRSIAQDLHDELGSAITEIVQLGDLAIHPGPESEALRSSVQTMTALARRLGVTLDEIVWTVTSRNDSLPNLVGYISSHAQEFFHHAGIVCRLDVTKNIASVPVDSQTRHNLFLAVKEALNNVAKHSGATEVFLRIHCENNLLRISIEDNGKGFTISQNRPGEGLTNMRERLRSVDGKAEFFTQPGGGTKVVFTLGVAAVSPADHE
ncbi:MAG TPA: two-component regulator propeller domain-containing protein [Verrucomicrobiae bacterium]|nr:two-component regulator propeller domain-containing protein [Verrucomicrobiae bacterium]